MLSDARILEKVLGFYQEDNGDWVTGMLSAASGVLGLTSFHTAAVPLFQMTGSQFTGMLTTLVWPTATVTNPFTLVAGLVFASIAWARHKSESKASEVASQLKNRRC